VLSIANFNIHCGMDGWGRPYDLLGAVSSVRADVMVLEEAWTDEGDDTGGQAALVARHLGYQLVYQTLGEGRRIRTQAGADEHWSPRPIWKPVNRPLYMDGVKPVGDEVRRLERWQEAQPGTWGLAVLVQPDLPIEDTRLIHMTQLQADRVRRAALVVDLRVDGTPLTVAGTHMSHLLYGSPRHWAELHRGLRRAARPDAAVAGDMNAWGPLVRMFMPGWRRAVVGATWPTRSPHSQIDHILVRGRLRPTSGRVFPDVGSDHRPVRVELELSP
jgi:endonuclease/exonuclease/phosphatase family metal-dependent hydrolase